MNILSATNESLTDYMNFIIKFTISPIHETKLHSDDDTIKSKLLIFSTYSGVLVLLQLKLLAFLADESKLPTIVKKLFGTPSTEYPFYYITLLFFLLAGGILMHGLVTVLHSLGKTEYKLGNIRSIFCTINFIFTFSAWFMPLFLPSEITMIIITNTLITNNTLGGLLILTPPLIGLIYGCMSFSAAHHIEDASHFISSLIVTAIAVIGSIIFLIVVLPIIWQHHTK